jgi:protein-S-isoprenylcysteine O-methyltransferase Ste14
MNILILTTGTVFLVIFTWFLSLRFRRYHGIARFFAFESIFIMVIMNYSVWFKNPFSPLQILSWLFLCISPYFAFDGYITLKKHGKPDNNFENTSRLVSTGIYHYIRHPLYLSVFMLGTGVMLKDPGVIQLILGLINLAAIFITAKIEEKEMIDKFGTEYLEYMKDTKMFIPFLL